MLQTLGAASLGTTFLQAAKSRRLKIGHTSITWGFKPENAEPGIVDSAKLGYHGYESLGGVLEALEATGGIGKILEANKMPLPSAYLSINLTDPSKRKGEVEKAIRQGKLLKKYGGSVAVIGPNGVDRATYDFKAAKPDVVATLNEVGKALSDLGLSAALHQHTRTCVETRDEVYAVMDLVNTKHVQFGPDVGQLVKAGTDPVKMLKDFQSLLRNIHLKDFSGTEHWEGYCPLSQGKLDVPAVMDVLEKAKGLTYVMVELDPSPNPPLPAFETAKKSKEYLQTLGYKFR
jgi:inosose dehydratase